jgi:hypothetical protein
MARRPPRFRPPRIPTRPTPRRAVPRGGTNRRGLGLGPGSGRHSHAVLATAALGLFLVALWFGTVVIGDDNPIRSVIMAAVIVAIAAAGYVFTRQPAAPRE